MFTLNLLARILENNWLTGSNYKDWLKNLKIILSSEKLSYILDQDLHALLARPTPNQKATYEKWLDDSNKARCYMLASKSNELQHQHEDMKTGRSMLAHL